MTAAGKPPSGGRLFAAGREERVSDTTRERIRRTASEHLRERLRRVAREQRLEGLDRDSGAPRARDAHLAAPGLDVSQGEPGPNSSQERSSTRWAAWAAASAAAVGVLWLAGQSRNVERPPVAPEPQPTARGGEPLAPSAQTGTGGGPLSMVGSRDSTEDSAGLPEKAAKSPPRVGKPSLEQELRRLELVRGALARGEHSLALALLREYQALPGTQLGDEAELLRIQALSASGNHSGARQRAQRFVEAHPGSPLVDRARSFLEPEP